MQFLNYTIAKEYINKFKHLEINLPANKMTNKDKKFHFTVNLPGHLCFKLLSKKCDTLDNLCHFVREYKMVTKISNYLGSSGNFSFNNYQGFSSNKSHFRCSSHSNFTPARRTSVSASTPMDLDVCCYNCNKIGHLSKDFPSPRKIKYNNSKEPDKHCARPSLNLINLDPPENSKSSNNLFFIQPTKPEEEESYNKINADLIKINKKLSKKFHNMFASINQEIWNIDSEK
jgi:hypothetical protein